MSAQPAGVLFFGVEPPPDSREPRKRLVIWAWSASTPPRSACVIWPTFSGRVIRFSRSLTRVATGSFGFWYGSPCALTTTVVRATAVEPVANWTGTVLASAAEPVFTVWTVTRRAVPLRLPAADATVALRAGEAWPAAAVPRPVDQCTVSGLASGAPDGVRRTTSTTTS